MRGFAVAFVFFYMPLAVLFITLEKSGQIDLNWYHFCISVPYLLLTITIGKILDGRGELK